MRIKSRHYLYLFPKNRQPQKCSKCTKTIDGGDLNYTKPMKKIYCAECSYILGFITGIDGDKEN